tara:strand:+ start:877 stop:1047 length:171 start_codon:yes stop_codon:yes gene_type:complete
MQPALSFIELTAVSLPMASQSTVDCAIFLFFAILLHLHTEPIYFVVRTGHNLAGLQ